MFARLTSVFLYIFLLMASITLLGLTAYRTNYTRRLNTFDVLTNRHNFYNPTVVELLVTSIFAILISIAMIIVLITPNKGSLAEIIALFVIFVMFLVGAAIFTSDFSNLAWCRSFKVCRVLETIKAFSWICWGLVVPLFVIAIYRYMTRNRASRDGISHGHHHPETRAAPTSQPVTTPAAQPA